MPDPRQAKRVADAKPLVRAQDWDLDLCRGALTGIAGVGAIRQRIVGGGAVDANNGAVSNRTGVQVAVRAKRRRTGNERNRIPVMGIVQLRTAAKSIDAAQL